MTNPAFSAETEETPNTYPNYSYEFTGEDKWENFNRKVFFFNSKVSGVSRPLCIFWASIMPKKGMEMITNFYTNIKYPIRLTSSLVQGDFDSAWTETKRVGINSTIGFLGLYDAAWEKYNIAPRKEDMAQALAKRNLKPGNYIVLPLTLGQGNVRDFLGQAIEYPLNPTLYFGGDNIGATIGSKASKATDMTIKQPMFTLVKNYADPYEMAKQLDGIYKYILSKNIDRRNFVNESHVSQNFVNTSLPKAPKIKADIELENYNPQNRETDALRTLLFDSPKPTNSKWAEMSIWNKDLNKKFKISSLKVEGKCPKYKYRYLLQENKNAPLAILYPSIGEGIMSNQSTTFARKLYEEGYSVLILGSSFNWAFARSMPDGFRPGLPSQDAQYLRAVTAEALYQLQKKYDLNIQKKVLVGTSFGALTGLFVAQQEEKTNTLGISKYIFICPPVETLYALKQVDKYSQIWKTLPDYKDDTAVVSQKVVVVSNSGFDKEQNTVIAMPFNESEAELAISYTMRQKLYDLIFTLERQKSYKKNDLYENFTNMDFSTYAEKYLIATQNKSEEQLNYETSLYSLANFLKTSQKYKIYEAVDDCFTTPQQIVWLKKQSGKKTVLFSNGSHLGFLYRPEFMREFTKDIKEEL